MRNVDKRAIRSSDLNGIPESRLDGPMEMQLRLIDDEDTALRHTQRLANEVKNAALSVTHFLGVVGFRVLPVSCFDSVAGDYQLAGRQDRLPNLFDQV